MLEKTSRHIEKLMATKPAVARQFVALAEEQEPSSREARDPLLEESYEVVRGMIHKYPNRVLCLLTAECAAYCRFCTRRRIVSDIVRGKIDDGDIARWAEYLQAHSEVREVILSGGDPFVVSDELFSSALKAVSNIENIKVIRIGTRVPVAAPDIVTVSKLRSIAGLAQPVYIGVHFEHPSELTAETIAALGRLRRSGAILYSQTVFLAGVNDDFETLRDLFTGLVEVGVRPYYIYRCDPVAGAGHFRVESERERSIMTALRKSLSGIACPTYVVDTPNGSGKIPVPLGFWNSDARSYRDFCGKEHELR
jgi:lysine 2,3-aminomutase